MQQVSLHQATQSSNNSTLVFRAVDIAQDFDEQKSIFKLIDRCPYLFCFNEQIPYQIYGESRNVNNVEESIFLGKGSFGKVYCVINYLKSQEDENIVCALKIHKDCDYQDIVQLRNEYEIQWIVTSKMSDCVVSLVDKVFIKQQIANSYEVSAVMELGFINLYEYISRNPEIKEKELDEIYNQILNAIINLHSLNIAHRDIKPSNIVYIQKKGWVLADFGCSVQYQNTKGYYQIVGTKAYLPQKLRAKIQGSKQQRVKMNLFENDIHAFLITILQIRFRNSQINELEIMISNRNLNDNYLSIYDQTLHQIQQQYKNKNITKALIEEKVFESIIVKLSKESENQEFAIKKAIERSLNYHINLFYQVKYNQKNQLLSFFTDTPGNNFSFHQEMFKIKSQSLDQLKLITNQIEKWQYDIIYKRLLKNGQIKKTLDVCKKYQEINGTNQSKLKLQEIELTFCLGRIAEARKIAQNITQEAYNFDEVSYLKYHCLKAVLFNMDNLELWQKISKYLHNLKPSIQVSDGFFMLYTELRLQEQVIIEMDKIQGELQPLQVYLNVQKFEQQYQKKMETSFYETVFQEYCNLQLEINVNGEILGQLQKKGFDCYAIFMALYFLSRMLSDIPKRLDQAKCLLQIAISYIDSQIPNYYFSWRLYHLYAQVLIKSNFLDEASQALSQAEKSLDHDQFQEKCQIEIENWHIYIKQKMYLTKPELFQKLPFIMQKITSTSQRQALIVNILERITGELNDIFSQKSKTNIDVFFQLLNILVNQFDDENSIDLIGNFFKFKLLILIKQGNIGKVLDNFNSILINLSKQRLLDSMQETISRYLNIINKGLRSQISQCKEADIINYHQRQIQLEIIDRDLFPNEDFFKNEMLKSIIEYANIIKHFNKQPEDFFMLIAYFQTVVQI